MENRKKIHQTRSSRHHNDEYEYVFVTAGKGREYFMKLQLALDLVDIPGAIEVVKEVQDHVDVVEIGTPVVINEGLKAVKEVKAAFPNMTILADLKIMDAAGYEVSQAAAAGADIITILGTAEDESIKGAVEEAKKQGKQILADMIAVKDIAGRAKELDELGVDYICVHTGYDLQAVGKNSFEDLATIKSVVKNAKTAIAGGIKLETLPEVIKERPDLVIVGGGITSKEDKKAAAAKMQELIQQSLVVQQA
jgi:3-hexulose-6-phosphate synthase